MFLAVYVGDCTARCLHRTLAYSHSFLGGTKMSARSTISTAVAALLLLAAPVASADESPVDGAMAPLAPSAEAVDSPMEQPVDTAKLYAGISLISAGGLATLGGGISYFALSASTPESGVDPYKSGKTGSILAMVLGGAAIGAGIPLILTSDNGDQAATTDKNSAKPTVRVGAASASAAWSF